VPWYIAPPVLTTTTTDYPSLPALFLISQHSTPKNRALGVLSNMPEFAAAYACKAGAKYNPEKKCRIW
jgi:predicted metalloendopeptidase